VATIENPDRADAPENASHDAGHHADAPAHDQHKRAKNGAASGDAPITIKKYANRRLYNTATSTYVTLDYLSEMVKSGQDFVVYDAKSGDDITRSVLTQIIFEEENKGQNLLPVQFLRQLIQFYGDNLQSFVPSYLEMSMNAFAENQEKIRAQMRNAFGATPGYKMFEETARQNMALFEQAMQMFNPISGGMSGAVSDAMKNAMPGYRPAASSQSDKSAAAAEIDELKAQLAALQGQLDRLQK